MPRLRLVAACAALSLLPTPSLGQEVTDHERWLGSTWVDDANFLAANALLGGVVAGVTSYLRSGSFSDGFTRGALGGGVAYVGKRIAAARFDGAGLAGRWVGAVGGSMTRNAALGGGLLDTLTLPVGPVWVAVTPGASAMPRVRLDLQQASWLLYGLTEKRLHLDWGRTLSAGAPVFQAAGGLRSDGEDALGVMAGGTLVLSAWAGSHEDDVFAHERVHVVQFDYLKATMGLPVEEWAIRRVHLDRVGLFRHVLLGLAQEPITYALFRQWSRANNPIEVEATFLEVR